MPQREHPEVKHTPELMMPATQETLRRLVGAVDAKTRHVAAVGGKRATDLYDRPDALLPAASTQHMQKGTSVQYPDAISYIRRSESVGNRSRITTNYYILDTPDGLQISKHITGMNTAEAAAMFRHIRSDENRIVLDLFRRAVEAGDAQAAERELGLDFVSEDEAYRLIETLDPLEPRLR